MPVKITKRIIRVAERILGLAGTPLPVDIIDKIGISLEARAMRPWELYDEDVILWHRSTVIGAGGVGRFGGVSFGVGGILQGELPALWGITRIENESANQVDVRITTAVPAYANLFIGGVFPRDLRNGAAVETANGSVNFGDLAAVPGTIIAGTLNPGEAKVVELIWEVRVGAATTGISIFNGTPNVATSVGVDGFLILRHR